MSTIAIIDNSHVGALREGWKKIATDYPGVELRFFPVTKPSEAGCHLEDLRYGLRHDVPENVHIQVRRINGGPSIDLSDCDTVLYAGREFPFQDFRSLIYHYDVDGLVELGSSRRISAPAFKALSAGIFGSLVPGKEWQRLARSGRKLYLALKPLVSEQARDHDSFRFWKTRFRDPTRHAAYYKGLLSAFERELAKADIGFVWQPSSTLTAEGLTAEHFSRGALKLDPKLEQPDDDFVHMNAEYGAIFLRAFFARIEPAMS